MKESEYKEVETLLNSCLFKLNSAIEIIDKGMDPELKKGDYNSCPHKQIRTPLLNSIDFINNSLNRSQDLKKLQINKYNH